MKLARDQSQMTNSGGRRPEDGENYRFLAATEAIEAFAGHPEITYPEARVLARSGDIADARPLIPDGRKNIKE